MKLSKIHLLIILTFLTMIGCSSIDDYNAPNQTINISSENSLSSLEQSIHQQINQYRQSINLSPLVINQTIVNEARQHSQNMAEGKVSFSHEGFDNRISIIANSITYSSAAENVAYNQGHSNPATIAVEGWLKSSGHLQNIKGDFNLTGVGVAQNSAGEHYFTQIFIKSR